MALWCLAVAIFAAANAPVALAVVPSFAGGVSGVSKHALADAPLDASSLAYGPWMTTPWDLEHAAAGLEGRRRLSGTCPYPTAGCSWMPGAGCFQARGPRPTVAVGRLGPREPGSAPFVVSVVSAADSVAE